MDVFPQLWGLEGTQHHLFFSITSWFRHLCTTAKNYDVLADIVTNGMLLDEDNIGSILSIAADVKIV